MLRGSGHVAFVAVLVTLLLGALAVGGISAEPVEIGGVNDLDEIRDNLDGEYVLVNDIDMSGLGKFEPISGGFNGSLDGRNNTISNLTIDKPRYYGIGLFKSIGEEGEVKNLILEDVDVRGQVRVGGLAGTNRGEIHRTELTGKVGADEKAGGLVGSNSGLVRDSNTDARVSGREEIGGLIGRNNNDGKIVSSYSTGYTRYGDPVLRREDVRDKRGNKETMLVSMSNEGMWRTPRGARDLGTPIGGVVGTNSGKINQSYATGDVLGFKEVGGLVGRGRGNVSQSYATGNVTGMISAGGLIGSSTGDIDNSYATGNVWSGDYAGGLGGSNSAGTIADSYAEGDVFGGSQAGGLVGNNDGYVVGSYSTGDVGASKIAGGVVGWNNGEVRYSYAEGNVVSEDRAGGLVGILSSSSTLAHSYWKPDGNTDIPVVGEVEDEVVIENVTPSYEPGEGTNSTSNTTGNGTEGLPGFGLFLSVVASFAVALRHKSKD